MTPTTPTYWGWCGCTVWPLALGYRAGRCGRCRRKPVFVVSDIAFEPSGMSRAEAAALVEINNTHYAEQLAEANE